MSDPAKPRLDLAADLQHWTNALADAEQEAARSPAGARRARALLGAARAKWHLEDYLGCVRFAIQSLADKDLNTPALGVSAMTLAAFALIELGAIEQARPLAQRALMLTRVETLFDQLPIALSCAAAVDSVGGEFDRAEGFHLEALARARQGADLDPLQMALCNLLSSYIAILRYAALKDDATLRATVEHRSRAHVVHARHLKDDPRLSPWRRLILQQNLGEFLGLCGVQPEGEALLADCLAQAMALMDPQMAQTIAIVLAEQLAARGQHQDALTLLETHVRADQPHRGGFRRRLEATRTAEACLWQLGRADEAARMAQRIARDVQEWETLRREAIRLLPG